MSSRELTGWRAYTILKIEEADNRAGGGADTRMRRRAGVRVTEPQGAPTQPLAEDWADTGPNELPPDEGIGGVPIPPAALWD